MCHFWVEKDFYKINKWYKFYFHRYCDCGVTGISFRYKNYRITYHFNYKSYLTNKWDDMRNRVGIRRRNSGLPHPEDNNKPDNIKLKKIKINGVEYVLIPLSEAVKYKIEYDEESNYYRGVKQRARNIKRMAPGRKRIKIKWFRRS